MTKYRLVDLAYNPNEPRDSRGRWTSGGKVALKSNNPIAYMVNGRGYDASGKVALRAAPNPAAEFLHQTPAARTPAKPGAPFNTFATIKPVATPKSPAKVTVPDNLDVTQAKSWYETITKDDSDSDNLSSDLGLNPRYRERSLAEIRKAIKAHETKEAERKELRRELHARVNLAKAAAGEKMTLTNKLTKKLEEKPEDADLAPIIGETLAEHPKLGPLAHIWDRLRLAGFKFHKAITSDEAGDELPRILARSAVNVVIALLAIHLGLGIPGLVPGGGDG